MGQRPLEQVQRELAEAKVDQKRANQRVTTLQAELKALAEAANKAVLEEFGPSETLAA